MARKALLGHLGDVDIRLLRVFRAVVKSGGLAAAELELNIGRSTISKHISDLELRLGMTLCNRGPGGFSLTGEGEQVLSAIEQLLMAINTFKDDVADVHEKLTGRLKIALFDLTVTNPAAKLSHAFHRFEQQAPEVELDVAIEPTNVIEAGIFDGHFDIGIIPIHRKSTGLNYADLYSEQMYLYCGQSHPLFDCPERNMTAAQIRKCKYAGLGFHSPNLVVGNKMNLTRAADVHDQEALALLILSGCYIGFLPDHFAEQFVARKLMRTIGASRFSYQSFFSAITRRHPPPSRKTKTFLSCLCEAHGSGCERSG